jgi:hypothetical protein
MKAVRYLVILLVVYAGIVTAFESLIGTFQPTNDGTLVITTFDADKTAHPRVVARLENEGHLYVAANHWPRAWYRRALRNPEVQATIADKTGDYRAVDTDEAERARVNAAHPLPFAFRVLTGFPPRYFLRLDPREPASGPSAAPGAE